MSLKSKVQRLESAAGGAGCALRVACCADGTRTPHPATRLPFHASRFTPRSRAFTLIEIMIVVGIMGIVMAMSVPIVYKVWRKAPMTQALKDIVEVCSHARARAIMQGTMTEVVLHPRANRLAFGGGSSTPSPPQEQGSEVPLAAPAATSSGLSAQLSDKVIIETLDVNMSGIEFNDAEEVRIRFYPNGISDEMRMILFDGRDRMGIELEITTGLVNVVPNPLQAWVRR